LSTWNLKSGWTTIDGFVGVPPVENVVWAVGSGVGSAATAWRFGAVPRGDVVVVPDGLGVELVEDFGEELPDELPDELLEEPAEGEDPFDAEGPPVGSAEAVSGPISAMPTSRHVLRISVVTSRMMCRTRKTPTT
jgi:hypothetical protein